MLQWNKKDQKLKTVKVYTLGKNMIVCEIAVATISGKAYYKLVTELKERKISFLSLKPEDHIPFYVNVVITTESEKEKIQFKNVIVYNEDDKPNHVIDKALQIVKGKNRYKHIIVGVDPGKRFGVVFVGDNYVLKMVEYSNIKNTAQKISEIIDLYEADKKTVRVGDGATEYSSMLVRLLDVSLSKDIIFESVKEEGTTRNKPTTSFRNIDSALHISMRSGKQIERKTT
jgi:hypothetical protein